MYLFSDANRLALNSWNIGHGNKILHLLFLVQLADKWGIYPAIKGDSSLDEIFDLSDLKVPDTTVVPGTRIFAERSAFKETPSVLKALHKAGIYLSLNDNLPAVVNRSKTQFEEEVALLENGNGSDFSGYISGHFWHYDLMPSADVFARHVHIRADQLSKVRTQYPDIERTDRVSVHLRDTDFKTHLRHIFKKGIMLPDDYYRLAIETTEQQLGSDITYHLFSDNRERITKLFEGKRYILHQDNATTDWVSIFLSKHIIQSNSSFCWTASLYNKECSIQPEGGYNWAAADAGPVPYGFLMPFSRVIRMKRQ